MAEKKGTKTSKHKGGCLASLSIRLKAYILLGICFIVAAAIIVSSLLIPLSTMRDLEEKQVEIDVLTVNNDLLMDIMAFKDIADAALRDISFELRNMDPERDPYLMARTIHSYFLKNGVWNGDLYKSGFAFYSSNRTMFIGENHPLETGPRGLVVNETARPLGEKVQGRTPESQEFLKRILLDDRSWYGVIDIGTDNPYAPYYPIYAVVTVPFIYPGSSAPEGWIALFMDQRLSVSKTVRKLKYCAVAIPGNSVVFPFPREIPRDIKKYGMNLKATKFGHYRSMKDADGTFRTLIHNQNGLVHEGFTSCYDEEHKIYEQHRYFGTSYFAIRDMAYDLPNVSIAYVRIDHDLEIMGETLDYIALSVVLPSGIFIVVLIIVVVIYVEVGVMHRLDQAKKSLHQIVLERRAILEQYLKDDKVTRNYYSFSKGKGKEGETFDALLEEIAEDAGGRGDELGVLMNMSSSIGAWMENILQDKMKRLESARKENTCYYDAIALLSAWCRRSDVRFTPSYIATDVSFNKSSELKSRFDAFTRTINLSHILGNGVALEMFKSYCRASGNEGSLYFVLDVAWLTMMEEALHSKGGDASGTDTSGSVSVAHGGVTHSQIVRLVQTIFSTYIFSPDHPVVPIGLPPSGLKRLIVRADAKGKVKYAKGLFKSTASDVRRYIDSEIIPVFKDTAQFRALFMLLNSTSQIEVTSSGEATIYAWPFIQKSNSDEGEDEEKGRGDKDDEDDNEGKKKIKTEDIVLRLPLGVTDSESIAALVEEEKTYQRKNADASIATLPSATGQSSSKRSLPGSSTSPSNSRSKLRAISPFAALLPGSKRKTSNAGGQEGETENSGEEKKDKEWMKKSFALTNRTSSRDGSGSGGSEDE